MPEQTVLELLTGDEGAQPVEKPEPEPQPTPEPIEEPVAEEGAEPEPEAQPEPEPEGEPEQPDASGKLFAGKYKDVSALEKGYLNANGHISKIETENRVLKETLAAIAATRTASATHGQPVPLTVAEEQPEVLDAKTKEFLDTRLDPETQKAVRLIVAAETSNLRVRAAEAEKALQVSEIKNEFPNYTELMPDVQTLINRNPGVYARIPAIELFRIAKGMKPASAAPAGVKVEDKAREAAVKRGFVDGGGASAGAERTRPQPKKKSTREDAVFDKVFGGSKSGPMLVSRSK